MEIFFPLFHDNIKLAWAGTYTAPHSLRLFLINKVSFFFFAGNFWKNGLGQKWYNFMHWIQILFGKIEKRWRSWPCRVCGSFQRNRCWWQQTNQLEWIFRKFFFSHRIQHRFAIVSVIKSVSKNRLQHWHSHCDFSMNILANYYFILQIYHAKTFKMRYSSSK